MKLSELAIEKIKPGLKVISAIGTKGVVSKVLPPDREDHLICIDWDNGDKSMLWHFWGDKIIVDSDKES